MGKVDLEQAVLADPQADHLAVVAPVEKVDLEQAVLTDTQADPQAAGQAAERLARAPVEKVDPDQVVLASQTMMTLMKVMKVKMNSTRPMARAVLVPLPVDSAQARLAQGPATTRVTAELLTALPPRAVDVQRHQVDLMAQRRLPSKPDAKRKPSSTFTLTP